jgi:hypothetical protein
MMPLSYNGLGFTAILIMVSVLVAGQGIRYLKEWHENRHHKQQH